MKSVLFSAAAAAALMFAGVAMAQDHGPSPRAETARDNGAMQAQEHANMNALDNANQNSALQDQTTTNPTTPPPANSHGVETRTEARADRQGPDNANANATENANENAGLNGETTTATASSGAQVAANAPDSDIPRRHSSDWLNQRELARLQAQPTQAVAQATPPAATPAAPPTEQPG